MTERPYDAVLLIGFGGPTCAEEVRPFLESVLRGRPVPPERFEEVARNYEVIGGCSPFNELTLRQAGGLERILRREGDPTQVYVGMRNWRPFLADVLAQMIDDGVHRVLGIILAPHQGEASWGRYQSAVREAQQEVESKRGTPPPRIDYSEAWFDHPLLIEAFADRLRCRMDKIPPDRRAGAHLVFTAHSVPVPLASPYVDQLMVSCRAVAEELAIPTWELAYQSRSGNPRDPWLGPDICEVIRRLGDEGCKDVVLAPIGFVCDHVEVLFDLDVQARQVAHELGMGFYRSCTVNAHPSFSRLLADLVQRAQQRSASG